MIVISVMHTELLLYAATHLDKGTKIALGRENICKFAIACPFAKFSCLTCIVNASKFNKTLATILAKLLHKQWHIETSKV